MVKRERVSRPSHDDEAAVSETHEIVTDLETGLRIDEDALEEALLSQPDSFYRVAKALAQATSRRDAAKQSLAEEESRADARVRADAAAVEEKVTEKEVESQKRLDPDVKEAQRVLNNLNSEVAQLGALKEAFGQRSYVLKDLVQLYLAGYFGDLSNVGNTNDMKTRDSKDARKGMSEERRRRTKTS